MIAPIGTLFEDSVNARVEALAQTQQSGQAIHIFVTRSAHQGTWLFAPAQGGNG